MSQITYDRTYGEDDTTYVRGPRGVLCVSFNGADYDVTRWNPVDRDWTKPAATHLPDYLGALKCAAALVGGGAK